MSKITLEVAQEIIDKYVAGESSYKLAEKYGLWQTSICNIVRGKTWKQCIRPKDIENIIFEKSQRGLEIGRSCKNLPKFNDLQKDILVGSLLGDGHLRKNGNGNCRFAKKQRFDRKEYLEWHFQQMDEYSANLYKIFSNEKLKVNSDGIIERLKCKKYHSGYCYETFSHPNLTDFYNLWYDTGKKIVPLDVSINYKSFAIWYCDDGHNCFKQRYAIICTQSFSFDEAELLKDKLEKLNLQPKIIKVKSKYTEKSMPILKFSRNSYDNLISIAKDNVIWDCFSYKILTRSC
jgi:hypothetical protein